MWRNTKKTKSDSFIMDIFLIVRKPLEILEVKSIAPWEPISLWRNLSSVLNMYVNARKYDLHYM